LRREVPPELENTLRIPFYIPTVLAIAQTDLVLTVPRT